MEHQDQGPAHSSLKATALQVSVASRCYCKLNPAYALLAMLLVPFTLVTVAVFIILGRTGAEKTPMRPLLSARATASACNLLPNLCPVPKAKPEEKQHYKICCPHQHACDFLPMLLISCTYDDLLMSVHSAHASIHSYYCNHT